MAGSEEQRFDFFAEPVPDDAAELLTGSDQDTRPTPAAAEDLLARIAAVKAVATRRSGSRRPVPTRPVPAEEPAPFDDESSPAFDEEPDHATDADASDGEGSLSIAQFYERVRRALAREFSDEVWVTGEIRGIRESRGHRYLELADHDAAPAARGSGQQLEVVCWSREWPPVAAALAAAGVELEVGRVVRVRGKVSVWEGGSKLRFTLTALDVEALLGGIAQARRRLLAQLAAEDLLEANHRIPVGPVPLRVGIVASPSTEGFRDFTGQLERSGFAFVTHVEPTLVQGPEAPLQIAAALQRMVRFAPDLAVVIRGGGARGDLAAFDSEEVARAIATAPFPVWTGIGHTGDRSVADEVANRALITPSACGEAVVVRVGEFADLVARQTRVLGGLARARLDAAEQRASAARSALRVTVRHQLERRSSDLGAAAARCARAAHAVVVLEASGVRTAAGALARATGRSLQASENSLERRVQVLGAFDPRRQLERGWSLTTTASGSAVRSIEDLSEGDEIATRLVDGLVTSRVTGRSAPHAKIDP